MFSSFQELSGSLRSEEEYQDSLKDREYCRDWEDDSEGKTQPKGLGYNKFDEYRK